MDLALCQNEWLARNALEHFKANINLSFLTY